jgi:hypothetical protein
VRTKVISILLFERGHATHPEGGRLEEGAVRVEGYIISSTATLQAKHSGPAKSGRTFVHQFGRVVPRQFLSFPT